MQPWQKKAQVPSSMVTPSLKVQEFELVQPAIVCVPEYNNETSAAVSVLFHTATSSILPANAVFGVGFPL
jgi:hypothetical protein